MELQLPVVSLGVLGEAGVGIGYGNLFEYRLGGMAELYFFRRIGLGFGYGLYGNEYNWGIFTSSSDEEVIRYASQVMLTYYRFALILRGDMKTSFYAERYADGNWGFGMMFGGILFD